MSAIPPKADIADAMRNVRFVPIADIGFRRSSEWIDVNGSHLGVRSTNWRAAHGPRANEDYVRPIVAWGPGLRGV
jgi:hypothetical protein